MYSFLVFCLPGGCIRGGGGGAGSEGEYESSRVEHTSEAIQSQLSNLPSIFLALSSFSFLSSFLSSYYPFFSTHLLQLFFSFAFVVSPTYISFFIHLLSIHTPGCACAVSVSYGYKHLHCACTYVYFFLHIHSYTCLHMSEAHMFMYMHV